MWRGVVSCVQWFRPGQGLSVTGTFLHTKHNGANLFVFSEKLSVGFYCIKETPAFPEIRSGMFHNVYK